MTGSTPAPGEAVDSRQNPATPDGPTRGSYPIGVLLEKARRRLGYSLETVSREMWISKQELDNYESGLRTPSRNLVERLAEFYGSEPSRFRSDAKAERVPAENEFDEDTLWLGWAAIDISECDGSNDNLLRSITHTLRAMRSCSETTPITVRSDEVAVIAEVLDLEDNTLHKQLMHWLTIDDETAGRLISRLRRSAASATASASASASASGSV